MIKSILRAKNWQIFIVIVALPIIGYAIWMYSFFNRMVALSKLPNGEEMIPQMIFGDMKYVFIFGVVISIFLMCWQWSVAIGLQDLIAPNLKLNLKTFKALLVIPLMFTIGYMYWMQSFFYQMPLTISNNIEDMAHFQQSMSMMKIIMPLSILSMACSFYVMYVCAKTIKTAETQRELKFGDFVVEIVLIWFFPVGIWMLQPRLNALMNKEAESSLLGSLIE